MDPTQVQIVERYCAQGSWIAETALHIGGEAGDFDQGADMVLLRDADGRPYIPGASLAGACRSHLRGSGKEPDALLVLFGGDVDRQKDKLEYASALTVFDARPRDGEPVGAFVRDGVRIDRRTGIAEDKHKFDYEVLPAGTQFQIRLELVVYSELPYFVKHDELLGMFRAMLEALADGRIRLGARTRRGLGRGKVSKWSIQRIDMKNKNHVIAWLRREASAGDQVPLANLPKPPLGLWPPWFTIEADLELKTSVLIRSGGEEARVPDMVHLSENGQPLLTGTSLAGILRSRCERIARTLFSDEEAIRITEAMFGTWHRREEPQKQIRAGRVVVEETKLCNGGHWVQGRVAIDRLTGGALETALFDEAPYYPDPKPKSPASPGCGVTNARIMIRLCDPNQTEVALLLQSFKDLWLGDLPVGGEAGVGRGVFRGRSATIGHDSFGRVAMTAADPADPANVKLEVLEGAGGSAGQILAELGRLSRETAQ